MFLLVFKKVRIILDGKSSHWQMRYFSGECSMTSQKILQVLHQKTPTMIAWSSDLHKMIRWSLNFTVCTYPDPACACVHVKNLAEKKTNATWFCQFHFRNFQHHFATKSLGTSQQQRILSRLNHFQKLMQKRTTVGMLVVFFVVQLFERKRVTQFNVMNMDQNRWESSMHVFQFLEIKSRIIILSTRKVLPQLFSTQSHRFPVALVLHPHPHTWRDRFLVGTKNKIRAERCCDFKCVGSYFTGFSLPIQKQLHGS